MLVLIIMWYFDEWFSLFVFDLFPYSSYALRVCVRVLCPQNGSAMSVIRRRWEHTVNASLALAYRAYEGHTGQIIWKRGVPSQEQTDGNRYTRSSAFYFLLMERLD